VRNSILGIFTITKLSHVRRSLVRSDDKPISLFDDKSPIPGASCIRTTKLASFLLAHNILSWRVEASRMYREKERREPQDLFRRHHA